MRQRRNCFSLALLKTSDLKSNISGHRENCETVPSYTVTITSVKMTTFTVGEARRSITTAYRVERRNASATTRYMASHGLSYGVQTELLTSTAAAQKESASVRPRSAVEMMSSDEIRMRQIRELIVANEPDSEYEFEICSSSYDQLKSEFSKDDENDLYPRLFYDWTRQVVTIVTVPSHLHENTSRAILSNIFYRTESIMRREQIHLTADESLSSSNSPRILVNDGRSRYHMEPDGVIFFQTKRSLDYKVVVEIGISQTLDGLLEKARKWIFGKKCKVVFLLGFNEKSRYSAPPRHIFMGSREVDEQVEEMRLQWEAQDHSEFGPVVLQGHTWLDNICEGFIEVVRLNPHSDGRDASDALFRRSYDLINQGMNESSGVARSVGELRLDELIPRESLGNEAAGDIVIDFFDADDFMSIVRRAMINTAVDRFENAIKIV